MPASDPEQDRGRRERRDTHDRVALGATIIACAFTGMAAVFTHQQVQVARDQTRRALRAYVVVEAELGADRSGAPSVWFKAENMGQTPVYDLMFYVHTAAVDREFERLPFSESMRMRCRTDRPAGDWEAFAVTFSKSYSLGFGINVKSVPAKTLEGVFRERRSVYGYGTACYRDIFDQPHAFRFCYQWASPEDGPHRCSTGNEGAPTDR